MANVDFSGLQRHRSILDWMDRTYACGVFPWSANDPKSMQFYNDIVRAAARIKSEYASSLDIGCYTGVLTKKLGRISKKVLGVDKYPQPLSSAQEGKQKNVYFNVSELPELKNIKGKFDLIVCSNVLYYLPPEKRRVALKRIRDLLFDGGVFVVLEPFGEYPYWNEAELRAFVSSFEVKSETKYRFALYNRIIGTLFGVSRKFFGKHATIMNVFSYLSYPLALAVAKLSQKSGKETHLLLAMVKE